MKAKMAHEARKGSWLREALLLKQFVAIKRRQSNVSFKVMPRAALQGYDPRSAYKLVFPRKHIGDYVLIKRTLSLYALSFCFWMAAIINQDPHILTVSGGLNDVFGMWHISNKIGFMVSGKDSTIDIPKPTDHWHHTCVTWKGKGDGTTRFYSDGLLVLQTTLSPNFNLVGNAAIVIGQDQDSFGGGFQQKQAFCGDLAEVNMWDYVLEPSVITHMAASFCDKPLVGNVVGWPEMHLNMHGSVRAEWLGCQAVSVTPRTVVAGHNPKGPYKLVFPQKSTDNFVLIKKQLTLSALSFCFWMAATIMNKPHVISVTREGGSSYEICIWHEENKKILFSLNNEQSEVELPIPTDQWHHTCVTWIGRGDGTTRIYVNGLQVKVSNMHKDYKFEGNAEIVIGQEQDPSGGDFKLEQTFNGELAEVNMWNYVLGPTVVTSMAASFCDNPPIGNVVTWPELYLNMHGRVRAEWLGCQTVSDAMMTDECSTYKILTEPDREETYSNTNTQVCDKDVESGWYRFSGLAGDRMADSCVPVNYCGTSSPGWLRGGHPILQEGVVTRAVCFHRGGNCCSQKLTIGVRNCGSFYVYQLKNIGNCDSRYCGAKPVEEAAYKLIFPSKSETDFVALERDINLSAVTFCSWLRMREPPSVRDIFSLATQSSLTELRLQYKGTLKELEMTVNGEDMRFALSKTLDDGEWHHVCVTWDSNDGASQIILDASKKATGILGNGHVISGQAILVVGHAQGSFGGGYIRDESFNGELTQVDIWSYVLDESTISRMVKFCEFHVGDVVAWKEFKGHTRGGVVIVPSRCPAAPGKNMDYVFSEASLPAIKGTVARFEGPYVMEAHNCLNFRYHMFGEDIGRLNVYLLYDEDSKTKTALWRQAGDKQGGWKTAQVPVQATRPYKIIFESVTGSGYRGDIAVDGITLGINEDCKLFPKKSQLRMKGIKSAMIGHILSYRDQLTDWVEEAGFGNRFWVPCYRALTDRWSKDAFMEKCSERGPSLTLIRKDSFVFGGFSDQDWKRKDWTIFSTKSFLFSLHAFGLPTVPTKFELLPSKQAEALTFGRGKSLRFGPLHTPDLFLNLNSGYVKVNLSNSYRCPNKSDPLTIFTGDPETQADDAEILIIGDSLCDPPCERAAACDEILGRCVCDPKRRDEEWCKLRLESQKKRDDVCKEWRTKRLGSLANVVENELYAKYERATFSTFGWRCFTEWALLSDHSTYDMQKGSKWFYSLYVALSAVTKDQLAVDFDTLLDDSRYYWPLEGKGGVENIQGTTWINTDKLGSIKRGLQHKAIEPKLDTGPILLLTEIASELIDPLGSAKGMTLAMWVYFQTTNTSEEQIFLMSGFPDKMGIKFSQPDGKLNDVALEIRSGAKVCTCKYSSYQKVWMHYLFTWTNSANCAQVGFFLNGEAKGSASQEEHPANFSAAAQSPVQIGAAGFQLPRARFDDILIWNVALSAGQAKKIYTYYKGTSNLKVFVSMEILQVVWSDSFNDPESENYQDLVQNITKTITQLYPNGDVQEVYGFSFSKTSGLNVDFTVSMNETGYAKIKRLEEFLRNGPESGVKFDLISFEPNEISTELKFTATALDCKTILVNFTVPETLSTGILRHIELSIERVGHLNDRRVEYVQAAEVQLKVENLIGLSRYNLTGVPWTIEGPGKEYQIVCTTLEGAPDAPPGNVITFTKTSSSISFKWDPVPADNQHGIVLGYHVTYSTADGTVTNVTVPGNQTLCTLTNLRPFTVYQIRIRAFTAVGSGPHAQIIATTSEGAPFAPPMNVTASLNANNFSINVSWIPIPESYHGGILKGYRIFVQAVNGTHKTAVMKGCKLLTSYQYLPVPERFTLYNITVAGFTVGGNSPRAHTQFVTPEDVPSVPPQNITTQNKSSGSVKFTWSPVPRRLLNGILRGYKVTWRRANKSSEKLKYIVLGPSSLEVVVKNLSHFTLYEYCIQAMTIGYGKCVINLFRTDESVPSIAPVIVRGYNTSSTSLKVEWKKVEKDFVHGILRGYAVKITHETSEYLLLSSCMGQSLFTREIRKLEKYTTYAVSIAVFTSKGLGPFSANLSVVTDEDIPDAAPQNISAPESTPHSLTLSWGEPDSKGKNGEIVGYRIILFDTLRNKSKNMTVYSSSVNLQDLFPYTSYEVRIVAFTRKGEGNASSAVQLKTREAAPSKPPREVKARNSSSSGIQLNWSPVEELFLNGKLRSYVIFYFETRSVDKIIYNTTVSIEERRRRRRAIAADEPNFELQGLKKFTTYTVQVAAYTVDVGIKSPLMNVTTAEDVPSRPPSNIIAYNTSSTSIRVEWEPVHVDHLNGILRGYKVYYRRANKPGTNFTVISNDIYTLKTDIPSLGKFKEYDIRVRAVTVGLGVESPPLLLRTDQDIPDGVPLNITTFPFNTTTIQMNWKQVPEELQNGIILGYKVMLFDEAVNNIRNTTVQGSNTTSVRIGGLDIWTNYSSKVCAFTIKGNGPWSSLIQSCTAEEAPRSPPTNVTVHNTSSTSLHVAWQPVNKTGIRGTLRGYRIFYTPLDTVHPKVLKNVSLNLTESDLDSLYKYTNYSISVVAYTIADGVHSEKVYARTHEDRPDKPPSNVTFSYPSSTSFLVEWKEVPLGYRNGIIRNYSVHYEQLDGAHPAVTEHVDANTFSLVIPGLKKFHYYNFTIWANTSIGSGPPSTPVLMTDQDVPEIPPPNITAENFVTTHTIPLQWKHIPILKRNGKLLGYTIRYEIVNMGQYPFQDRRPRVLRVGPTVSSVVLTKLENFAVYEIEVVGRTIKGEGPPGVIYAETCRCVKRLTTNWAVFEPYVERNVSGLLPPVFSDMTVECCRTCKSHGQSYVDFGLDGKDRPAEKKDNEEFRAAISQDTDFHFPVYGYKMQDRYHQVYGYIGLIESPGIAYIVNTDPGETIAQSVMMEIFGTWPLLMLCLLFAYLAGLLLWITERFSDSAQFPKSFISGAGEGLWWAFVTMTTVGYGDRTAFSIPGRIVGISWTLVGLVMNGILVSALATALTSVSSEGATYQLYGSKVAALQGSPEFHLSVRKNARLETNHQYNDYNDIQKLLVNQYIEGALIDAYTVGSKKHLFERSFLRINRIYDYQSTYGAVMGGDSRKLQKCFDDYIPMNIAKIFKHVGSVVKQIEEPEQALAEEISSNLFDTSSLLYQQTVQYTGGLLVLSFLLGAVYEVFYHRRLQQKVDNQDASPRKEQIDEMKEMLNELQKVMRNLVTELKEKHNRQLELLMCKRNAHRTLRYTAHKSSRIMDSHVDKRDESVHEGSDAIVLDAYPKPAEDCLALNQSRQFEA